MSVLVIGARFPVHVVGPYVAAIGLVAKLSMVPQGIADAMYPAVAHSYEEGKADVEKVLRRAFLYLVLVTAPISLWLTFAAPTVLWILFGSEYLAAANALRVAAWLLPLGGANYLIRECLSAIHRQDVVVRLTVWSVVSLLAFYAALVPAFGPTGAAIAAVGRELFVLLVSLRPLATHFSHPLPFRDLGRSALALGAMAIPFLLLGFPYSHDHQIAASAEAAVCYVTAVVLLRLVDLKSIPFLGDRFAAAG
jgi:O-antigen/teichoic acid export membrane protein